MRPPFTIYTSYNPLSFNISTHHFFKFNDSYIASCNLIDNSSSKPLYL